MEEEEEEKRKKKVFFRLQAVRNLVCFIQGQF